MITIVSIYEVLTVLSGMVLNFFFLSLNNLIKLFPFYGLED